MSAEGPLDDKFLLSTSGPGLSAEDVALSYAQLLELERGWRDMKSTLELRPACHHLERRIRAHVVLCWLALVLIQRAARFWRQVPRRVAKARQRARCARGESRKCWEVRSATHPSRGYILRRSGRTAGVPV